MLFQLGVRLGPGSGMQADCSIDQDTLDCLARAQTTHWVSEPEHKQKSSKATAVMVPVPVKTAHAKPVDVRHCLLLSEHTPNELLTSMSMFPTCSHKNACFSR